MARRTRFPAPPPWMPTAIPNNKRCLLVGTIMIYISTYTLIMNRYSSFDYTYNSNAGVGTRTPASYQRHNDSNQAVGVGTYQRHDSDNNPITSP